MIKISGLPAGVNDSDLEKLFSSYGKITVRNITTEENKSIALVELDGDINAAVRELNGKPFRGQCILTVEAHPSLNGIEISGLPAGVTKSDLEELFLPYGKITLFHISTKENKFIAYIVLDGDDDDIDTAVRELNRKPFRGQYITVEAHPSLGIYDSEELDQPIEENKNDQNVQGNKK